MCTLAEIIKTMAEGSDKPLKVISEDVGKEYFTLMRELNPHDQHAKLGIQLLIPLMMACNSIAPLEHLASRMGYRLVPISQRSPNAPNMETECLECLPALTAFIEAARGDADNDTTFRLFSAATREMEDVLTRKYERQQ